MELIIDGNARQILMPWLNTNYQRLLKDIEDVLNEALDMHANRVNY
jgi:hypothetical protein